MWDKVFVITFWDGITANNSPMIAKMHELLPEIPVAALNDLSTPGIIKEEAYKANTFYDNLAILHCVEDNAYHTPFATNKKEVKVRGYMPFYWTYTGEASIQSAILGGVYGITNNNAEVWKDYAKAVVTKDGETNYFVSELPTEKPLKTMEMNVVSYDGKTVTPVVATAYSTESGDGFVSAVYAVRTENNGANYTLLSSKITYYEAERFAFGGDCDLCVKGEWIIDEDPTCIYAGHKHRECTVCHKTVEAENIPADPNAHEASEWIVDYDPNCTETGHRYKKCNHCNVVLEGEVLPVDPDVHMTSNWIIDVEPTCSAKGHRYKKCMLCEKTLVEEEIEKLAHTPSEWTVDTDPTCTAKGHKHIECTVCHTVLEEEEIDKIAHTPSDWIIGKEPTETEDGYKYKECTHCHTELERETIEKTGKDQDEEPSGDDPAGGGTVPPSSGGGDPTPAPTPTPTPDPTPAPKGAACSTANTEDAGGAIVKVAVFTALLSGVYLAVKGITKRKQN